MIFILSHVYNDLFTNTFPSGIPVTALREITLLKGLRHENVVQLKDIVNEANRLYIVFELASSDLKTYG